MAKFIYGMQNVLNLKLDMEDQAKSAFADRMAELNVQEEALNQLIARRTFYEEEGRRMRESTLDVNEMRDNARAIDNLKEQVVAQEIRVDDARANVERARVKLQEAMQERKIQEKLKENAFEEFVREQNAAESKEIDELVSYRFGQARMESNNGR